MRVVYKKTIELSELEILEICNLFSEIFIGHERTNSQFLGEFLNNEFGYSYHGMLIDDKNQIVGSQAYIPYMYIVDGEKIKVALSVDTMILATFRNMGNIFKLWLNGHKELKNDDVKFIFGFPNENAYLLRTKGLKDKDIGDLYTYILPYRLSSYNPKIKYFDFAIKLFSNILILTSNFSLSKKTKEFRVERNRENFDIYRYKWFDGSYKFYKTPSFQIVYKIKMHNGLRTAFLMDIYPLTKKYFEEGVRHIFKTEKNDFDIMLYVGNLHFKPVSMIKIPRKFEPKKFHFTITLLDKNFNTTPLENINNWDINLASFDLI
jgi:hypothetical protein